MVSQKSLKLGRHVRERMKFMCTKYGWNAKKSVHFIDVFMGGIFLGSPCTTTSNTVIVTIMIFDITILLKQHCRDAVHFSIQHKYKYCSGECFVSVNMFL